MAMQKFGNIVVDPDGVLVVDTRSGLKDGPPMMWLKERNGEGEHCVFEISLESCDALVKHFANQLAENPETRYDPQLRAWAVIARDLLVRLRDRYQQMEGPESDCWLLAIGNTLDSLPESIAPKL